MREPPRTPAGRAVVQAERVGMLLTATHHGVDKDDAEQGPQHGEHEQAERHVSRVPQVLQQGSPAENGELVEEAGRVAQLLRGLPAIRRFLRC